jgi:hypothetical protein
MMKPLQAKSRHYQDAISKNIARLRSWPDNLGRVHDLEVWRRSVEQQILDFTRERTRIQIALVAAQARDRVLRLKRKADPKIEEALLGLKEEITTLQDQEKAIEGKIDEAQAQLGALPYLESLANEMEQLQRMARTVAEEVEFLKINLEAPSRVAVLQKAAVPAER